MLPRTITTLEKFKAMAIADSQAYGKNLVYPCEQRTQDYTARLDYSTFQDTFFLTISKRNHTDYHPVKVLEKDAKAESTILHAIFDYGMIDQWHVNTLASDLYLVDQAWQLHSNDRTLEYDHTGKYFAYSTFEYAYLVNDDVIVKIDKICDRDETSPDNEIYYVMYSDTGTITDKAQGDTDHSEFNPGTLEYAIDYFDNFSCDHLDSYATIGACLDAIGIPPTSDILQYDRLVPHLWHGSDPYDLDIAKQHILESLTIEKYRAFLIACYASTTSIPYCLFATHTTPIETYLYALSGIQWEVSKNANCITTSHGEKVISLYHHSWLSQHVRNCVFLTPENRELSFMTPHSSVLLSELLSTLE